MSQPIMKGEFIRCKFCREVLDADKPCNKVLVPCFDIPEFWFCHRDECYAKAEAWVAEENDKLATNT